MTAQKPRVLFIDDNVTLVQALQAGVGAHGYCTRGENDSRRALQTARDFRPDIIVLDMCMPGKDGGDVAQELGADPVLSKVPIIFLTSLVQQQEAGERTDTGEILMAKPVRIADLVQRIRQCLSS